jgi:putative transferase (TIGR04331 family)
MVLITTALQETFPKDVNEKVLFLGEWCKIYNNKSDWEIFNSQTMSYHWDDRKKLYRDHQNIQIIYEKILFELSNKLNQIHRVNYSLRYWRILIGPWLGYFTQVLFDRWFMLNTVFDDNQAYYCYVIKREPLSFVPNDMNHLQEWIFSDNWNEAIYGQLMELCWPNKVNITWIEKIKKTPQSFVKKIPIKKIIKEKILPFFNKLFMKDSNHFFISSYLPLKTELKLQVCLGQIPNIWKTQPLPIMQPCIEQRKWQLNGEKTSTFEEALRKMIPMHIPTAYLEGYLILNETVENLPWPKKPKSIFTSVSYARDDLFKAWAAKKTENNVPLIIGQHGGHFGMSPFGLQEDHQIKIADKWLSWGWHDKKRKNVTPVGNLKAIGKKIGYNPNGGALMVEMAKPRYSFHLYPIPMASQYLDYFNDQKIFLSSLTIELRQQVLLRLFHADFDWNQADRWKDSMPEVNIDPGRKNIEQLIRKSRLYIATYNATTYLESLTWNIPTIVFWNPEHWELNEQVKPYFELLEKAGILHTTPQSAAKKMIEIWDDVDSWWYSNETQKARKVFIEQYARLPEDPLNLLQDMLNY